MACLLTTRRAWLMLVGICSLFIFHQLWSAKRLPPYSLLDTDMIASTTPDSSDKLPVETDLLPATTPEPSDKLPVETDLLPSSTPDPPIRYFRHNSNFSLQPAFNLTTDHAFVVYVMSDISNPGERNMIRKTWGNLTDIRKYKEHKFNVQLMFVVAGLQYLGLEEQQAVRSEHQHHKDILTIDNLQESYGNLTEKSIYALNYIVDKFDMENVDFIFKVDSDTFINMFKYLSLTWSLLDADPPVDLICFYLKNKSVIRTGRYRETRSRYAPDTYPCYCSGPAYVASRRIILRLLSGAFKVPMLQSEDVMLTGVGLQHMEHLKVLELPYDEILFEYEYYGMLSKYNNLLNRFHDMHYGHAVARNRWTFIYSHLLPHYLS